MEADVDLLDFGSFECQGGMVDYAVGARARASLFTGSIGVLAFGDRASAGAEAVLQDVITVSGFTGDTMRVIIPLQ